MTEKDADKFESVGVARLSDEQIERTRTFYENEGVERGAAVATAAEACGTRVYSFSETGLGAQHR